MDFAIEVTLQYLTLAELEVIILGRHGDPVENLVLYQDALTSDSVVTPGSTDTLGSTKFFYDYFPPLDPFKNRPTAAEVYSTNPVLKTTCEEEFVGELADKVKGEPPRWRDDAVWKNTTQCLVVGGVRPWSKTAEHDPHTAKRLAEEAAAAEAKAKAEAEAAAAAAAAIAAEKAAIAAEKKRKLEEAAAKKKAQEEEEAREAAAAEAERLRKAEEEAMNDPVKRAEVCGHRHSISIA